MTSSIGYRQLTCNRSGNSHGTISQALISRLIFLRGALSVCLFITVDLAVLIFGDSICFYQPGRWLQCVGFRFVLLSTVGIVFVAEPIDPCFRLSFWLWIHEAGPYGGSSFQIVCFAHPSLFYTSRQIAKKLTTLGSIPLE